MIRYTFTIIILATLIMATVKSIKNVRDKVKTDIMGGMPAILALSSTLGFFLPSLLVLNNSKDFMIGLIELSIVTIPAVVIMLVFLLSIYIILPQETIRLRYSCLLTGITTGLYLQSNWINPKLPELDGRMVDWSRYRWSIIVNCAIWIIIIVLPQIIVKRKKISNLIKKGIRYVSIALIGVQLLVLIITVILPRDTVMPSIRLTKEGEFSLGKQKNVVIFVMDSLGSTNYEAAVSAHPDILNILDDFTYFSNEVAGGSYTDLGIPMLLTGVEYDPEYISYSDYLDDAWSTVDIYDKLVESGYDVRLYTDRRYITGVSADIIANAVSGGDRYFIEERLPFTKQLYKLTGYYAFPTIIKRFFWMNTTDIVKYIENGNEDLKGVEDILEFDEGVVFDDDLFHREFVANNGVDVDYDKAYRVYHMVGPHEPYTLGSDGYTSPDGISDEAEQIAGCFRIVKEYLEDMKKKNIYDSATIIITADHGPAGIENGIQQNSCLLIKQSDTKHDYMENAAPVHVRNLISTIADETGLDYMKYGPRVWDIDSSSDVERLHTARRASIGDVFPDIPQDQHSARFYIGGDATDVGSIRLMIGSERNRINYKMGDIIQFSDDSAYTKKLVDNLYYDKTGAIATNELFLNFELEGYSGGDLLLSFMADRVYNDTQRVRVYAEGERIATLDCKQADKDEPYTIVIPKEFIRNDFLPIRMVFPGAITPEMSQIDSMDNHLYSIHFDRIQVTEERLYD